jgi:hypothetical protein
MSAARAMVDTVKLSLMESRFRQAWPRHWKETERRTRGIESTKGRIYSTFVHRTLIDLQTGIRVHGDCESANVVEGSLSRTLFGHNGKMLKTQAELDEAIAKLWRVTNEVATAPESYAFTRIDLCFQLHTEVADFIRAHATYCYPRIRRSPLNIRGESLTWGGRNSDLLCRMYDKAREMKAPKALRGKTLRVEFQLQNQRLLREFAAFGTEIKQLSYVLCYGVARRLALQFLPRPMPKPTRLAEFLSVALRENWQSGGMSAFDLYVNSLSARQANRLRNDVAKCRVNVFAVDWNAMLPESTPPPAMFVDSDSN